MTNRTILIIAALLFTIFTGCSKRPLATATSPQTVSFSGYTNGVVGAIAPAFAKFSAKKAALIQGWLDAGTNGALFTITNQQSCDIWIYPLGRIINAGASSKDLTPLLNAPNFSGICLKPHQIATIQVALLPHQAPWQMMFSYTRTDHHVGLAESLRAMITHKPIQIRSYPIKSETIDQ